MKQWNIIKIDVLYIIFKLKRIYIKKNHILKFAALEIENFKITNKLIYMYINPNKDNIEN